jgi:hypothetical protein
MKIVERFQEVELQETREKESEIFDRMAGRLFRATYEGESLVLRLVLDTPEKLSQVPQTIVTHPFQQLTPKNP